MTIHPVPRQGIYERPFWDFVAARALHLQRCGDCRQMWYPPGPACPRCLSPSWEWTAVSGSGRLLSWTTFHRQYFPTLPTPYTIVAAALAEGPILITSIKQSAMELDIDMPMTLTYSSVTGDDGTTFVLYRWARQHIQDGYPDDGVSGAAPRVIR
jgi:uncharacterized OB-fold protein